MAFTSYASWIEFQRLDHEIDRNKRPRYAEVTGKIPEKYALNKLDIPDLRCYQYCDLEFITDYETAQNRNNDLYNIFSASCWFYIKMEVEGTFDSSRPKKIHLSDEMYNTTKELCDYIQSLFDREVHFC